MQAGLPGSFRTGIASAVIAQAMWGLFPLYWNLLDHVHPLEVLSHRNIWCAALLGLLIFFSPARRAVVLGVFSSGVEITRHLFSSALIALNWLVYIWAVVNEHVIDASLGYFLSPLVSVALGYIFLGERPDLRQWCAVGLAVIGVLTMVASSGVIPWIGLILAFTFGVYGLARKKASTGPVNGLFIETFLLVPITLVAIGWLSRGQLLTWAHPVQSTEILLALSGLVTAIPLVLYAQGARALPLTLSGLLVYITPTIQFLIGWLFYRETIDLAEWAGFVCIWAALLLYSTGGGQVRQLAGSSKVQGKAGQENTPR